MVSIATKAKIVKNAKRARRPFRNCSQLEAVPPGAPELGRLRFGEPRATAEL